MSAWMLYCIAVTTLLGAAASALDGALRSRGRREARWVWAGALGAAMLAGGAAAVRPHPASRPVARSATAGTATGAHRSIARSATYGRSRAAATVERHRAPLARLWAAASALALLWLGAGALRLRRARRSWIPTVVDGVPALVSPNVGPAVVGALRSEIVLPRWVLELDAGRRTLVIAHEREHVRARDPLLLAAAHAALLVAPWNPALWWLAAGLRRAVELDCDARVLRAHPDVRGYGTLLLEVGRRAALGMAGWGNSPAPAFLHASSSLERRIRIMTTSRTQHRQALRSLLVAAAALAAAAIVPRPPALLAQSASSGTDSSAKRVAGATASGGSGGSRRGTGVARAGSGGGSGEGRGGPPPAVVGVDYERGAHASSSGAPRVVWAEFAERNTEEQLAKGSLLCAVSQSPTGAARIELIVADEDAERPGRVTLLVDRSRSRGVSVTFAENTVDRLACGGIEAPWLRLSGAGAQRNGHVVRVVTPVALHLVVRTPGGRTLHDREVVPRTEPESFTFEW